MAGELEGPSSSLLLSENNSFTFSVLFLILSSLDDFCMLCNSSPSLEKVVEGT